MFYKVLDGVKVLEYGNMITAPFCAKVLADLGAEVIKVEDPACGDEARRQEPFLDDIPGPERSGLFLYLNMNKLGITLNLEKTTGKNIFTELLKSTDILVESNPPSKMEELGISYRYLKDVNPRLIMTSITAFGQTGPYKDYKSCDLVSCHMGGPAYVTPRGAEDTSQEPLKWGGHFGSFQAGLGSVVATLGALYHQKATGLGQHVDISELESVIQNMLMPLYYYAYGAQICARTDVLDLAPFNILPCKDGYIYLAPLEEKEWRRMLEVMGNPDWGDDELFKDGRSRAQYWDGLRPLILEWTMQRTMEEIFHSGQTKRVPVGALFTAKEIMNFKQFTAREFFVDMEHKEAGKLRYPGVPYKFSEVKRESPTAAPLLGQHNEEVYCQRLGYTKSDLIKLKGSGII